MRHYNEIDPDERFLGGRLYTEGRRAGEMRSEIITDMIMNGIDEDDAEAIYDQCSAVQRRIEEDDDD